MGSASTVCVDRVFHFDRKAVYAEELADKIVERRSRTGQPDARSGGGIGIEHAGGKNSGCST